MMRSRLLLLVVLAGLLAVQAAATTAAAASAGGVATTSAAAASGGSAAAANSAAASGAQPTPTPAPCPGTFPASYSNNTRFVILVASAGFILVAIVFLFMSFGGNASVIHVLVFLGVVTLGLGYFTLWEGIGSSMKQDGTECRVIFLARFITVLFSLPVIVSAFTLFTRIESSAILGGSGGLILTFAAWTLGTTIVGPGKYVWWVIGVVFAVASILHLMTVNNASNRSLTAHGASIANVCFVIFAASLLGYATLWVIGGTGTGYLSPSTEIAWYVLFDAIAHVAVAFALVTSSEASLDAQFAPLLAEQQNASFGQAYGSGASASTYTPGGFPGAYESRQYV